MALITLVAALLAVTLLGAASVALRGRASPVPDVGARITATPWMPGDPVFKPVERGPIRVGVAYHPLWQGMDQPTRAAVLDRARAAGVGWVRLDAAWGDFQPDGPDSYDLTGRVALIDGFIREVRQRGLKVLLLFYWAPQWSSGTPEMSGRPRDPAEYADAAAWVARRYSGALDPSLRIDAIELWNEPDLDRFWERTPEETRVSDFARLISLAGPAVRAANPQLTIVAGGISKLDPAWFEEFYATPSVLGSYDAMGLHAYPSPADNPPSAFDPSAPQYSLQNIVAVDAVMTKYGDASPLWITEYGWSVHSNPPFTRGWQRGTSEDEQAANLLEAVTVLRTSPRVAALFWYNLWSPPTGDRHLDGFGLLDRDLEPRPAYYAVKCLATGLCGPAATSTQGADGPGG